MPVRASNGGTQRTDITAEIGEGGRVIGYIAVRQQPEERRETGLGIEVQGQRAVALERKILRQMHGGARLADAPFEVRHRAPSAVGSGSVRGTATRVAR